MMEVPKIRCLIVDDDSGTRDTLRDFLSRHPEMELVGECSNGHQAIEAILKHKPDLIFLDVVLPAINGFKVLEQISRRRPPPCVVIVTAWPQYAQQAIEVDAAYFLQKPFSRKRLDIALQRAKKEIAAGHSAETIQRLLALLEKLSAKPRYVERLLIKEKEKERAFFLETNQIDWIESDGHYVHLHIGQESYELREALQSLEAKLSPKQFRRISRFTIVNIKRVKEIVRSIGHDDVFLKDGQKLEMSRDYRKNLMDF